jgi:hypothetical protein
VGFWLWVPAAIGEVNDPANGVRLSTETRSRRSVQPVFGEVFSFHIANPTGIAIAVNEHKLPNARLHELEFLLELRFSGSTHPLVVLSNAADAEVERESDIAEGPDFVLVSSAKHDLIRTQRNSAFVVRLRHFLETENLSVELYATIQIRCRDTALGINYAHTKSPERN